MLTTKSELDKIATTIGAAFPAHFQDYVITSAQLPECQALLEWHRESGGKTYLFYGPDELLRVYAKVRSTDEGVRWVPGDGKWPDQFLAIGEDGSGDYFCLDVSNGEDKRVWRYSHEGEGEFRPVYANLRSWLADWSERLEEEAEAARDRNLGNAPHSPGRILKGWLRASGDTEESFAQSIGMDPEVLRQIMAEEIAISENLLQVMDPRFAFLANQLRSAQVQYNKWRKSGGSGV